MLPRLRHCVACSTLPQGVVLLLFLDFVTILPALTADCSNRFNLQLTAKYTLVHIRTKAVLMMALFSILFFAKFGTIDRQSGFDNLVDRKRKYLHRI